MFVRYNIPADGVDLREPSTDTLDIKSYGDFFGWFKTSNFSKCFDKKPDIYFSLMIGWNRAAESRWRGSATGRTSSNFRRAENVTYQIETWITDNFWYESVCNNLSFYK